MKVLSTFKFRDEQFKNLEELGYDIIFEDQKSVEFSEDIKDIDILIGFDPFKRIDISMLPELKWIQLASAGANQVPVDKVIRQNILVTNNKGGYSIPIAEWIVLKILEMSKNSKEFHEKQKNKIWKVDTKLSELYGKTIGFIGTGSIAKEAAKRLEAFGVKILGVNTSGRKVEYFHKCFSTDHINNVAQKSHIIVVTVPYTEKTHHLINKDVLNNMIDGAYIINTARGSIIDEKALIDSLKSGKIAKAALDVFEKEPLPLDSPLWEMDNVYISPHNSWISEMFKIRTYELVHENLKRYKQGKELINPVDMKKGY